MFPKLQNGTPSAAKFWSDNMVRWFTLGLLKVHF